MFKIIKTLFRINAQENYLVQLEQTNQRLIQKSDSLEKQLVEQEVRFRKLDDLCTEMSQRTAVFEALNKEMQATEKNMKNQFAESLSAAQEIQNEIQSRLGKFHGEAQKHIDAVGDELTKNDAGIKSIQDTLNRLLAEVSKLH